nr:hypothetical protein [Tanacetum cinerariifolium]
MSLTSNDFSNIENKRRMTCLTGEEEYIVRATTRIELLHLILFDIRTIYSSSSILVGILPLSHSSSSYLRTAISNYGVSL